MAANSIITKPVIIIGAGGHAKVLINVLRIKKYTVIGIVDNFLKKDDSVHEYKVLGNDNIIYKYSPEEIELINGLGSISGNDLRWDIAKDFEDAGYTFANVLHPSALIADDVIHDQGVQIMAGVVIQPGTKIGKSSIINTGVIIDHDCVINENCHLAPGTTLSGNVRIGKGTHIGTGTNVINGINIGKNCLIAAGSVIYKNIPDNTHFIQKRLIKC